MAVIRLTKKLWKEYLHQNQVKASKRAAENRLRRRREALIVAHMALAEVIARQVWHRFTRNGQGGYGSRIELEDMVACAHVGLVEAAGRWEPSRGDFGKYCYLRVRGAVIDGHRRQAYLETQHTSIDEWFEEDNGQQGGETESGNYIARYLCDRAPLPDELTNRAQLDRLAAAAIARLPDEERDVIRAALAGAAIGRIGQTRGHSPAWVRAKLAAARDKVAAAVQGKAA